MAVLTRSALDALWINGFIPDEDDYIDRADTLIALSSASAGLYFGQFRFLSGVANDLSDLGARITASGSTPPYYLVQKIDGSVILAITKGAGIEFTNILKAKLLLFTDVGHLYTSPIGLSSIQSSTQTLYDISPTGISTSTLTDESVYNFDFWRMEDETGETTSVFVNGGADELVFTNGSLTNIISGS